MKQEGAAQWVAPFLLHTIRPRCADDNGMGIYWGGAGRNRGMFCLLGVASDGQVSVVARPRRGVAGAVRLPAHAGRRGPCRAHLCGLWRGLYRRGAHLAVGDRKSTRLNQSQSNLVCRLLLEKTKLTQL